MPSTENVDEVLVEFAESRREQAAAPPINDIRAAGSRRSRRRRIGRTVVGVAAGLVIAAGVAAVIPRDSGDRTVTADDPSRSVAPADATLEPVATSDPVLRGEVMDLAVAPSGDVWAARQGLGIFRYGPAMREVDRVLDEDPTDATTACCRNAVAVAPDGRVFTLAAVVGPTVDGHGEPELMAALLELDPSRSQERIVATFPGQAPGGTLVIAGDLAVLSVPPKVHTVRLDDGTVVDTATVDGSQSSIATAGDDLWVSTRDGLVRLSLAGLEERERTEAVGTVVPAAGTVWAIAADGTLKRVDDAGTGSEAVDLGTVLGLEGSAQWLWARTSDAIFALDPSDGRVVAEASLSADLHGAFAASADQAWIERVTEAGSSVIRYALDTSGR